MSAPSSALASDLTDVEAGILSRLACTLRAGSCPSRKDLRRGVGIGGRGRRISRISEGLDKKRLVQLDARRPRSMTAMRQADRLPVGGETGRMPVAGMIGASRPGDDASQLDHAFADEAVELTRGLLRGQRDVFALRVSGTSMVDALVSEGDLVILSAAAEMKNGDMVAARVLLGDGSEATTLRYFYGENGNLRLQHVCSDTGALPPHRPERVRVCGRVLLVVRQMTQAGQLGGRTPP